MQKVFVYGTLRAGQSNHGFLQRATLLGESLLMYGFRLYDLGPYPAAVRCWDAKAPLAGEVYEIDSKTFAALDVLEEYPKEYTREKVETEYGSAWIYLYRYPVMHFPVILNGDWCQRKEG